MGAEASVRSPETRWAWVEVSRSAIRHNTREFKGLLERGQRLMAVVKADAYGHGAVQCARTMMSSGADAFGVATVDEGIELRQAGVDKPIVILAEPPISSVPLIVDFDLEPSAYHEDFVLALGEEAASKDTIGRYHVPVDTGMTRIGLMPQDVAEFRQAVGWHRGIACAGTFTHFATAEVPRDWDFELQVRRFGDLIAELRAEGIDPGFVHCDNTAATILHPETHFDMVRVGLGLYGLYPAPNCEPHVDLRPAMSVRARITRVAEPPTGAGVSYGLTYRLSRANVQIATIPIGYADGYARTLSNRAEVLVDGMRCRQVGNICMDQCMFAVEVNGAREFQKRHPVREGEVVTLMGADGDYEISADELARLRGTISYEVCCDFGLRLEKVYV